MQFSELYGTELTREIGSADTTQLFTTVRRKAAINAAQLEFVKRTECLQKQTTIALVTSTQEYDLEATITDFGWITREGLSIKIVSGTTTRYIEGDENFERTTVERLTIEEPGWRAVAAGTPRKWYRRRNGGTVNIGLHPAPRITGTDTWTLIVPYVLVPTDMSADADLPFTVSSNPIQSLRPWHRALPYYAAFELEKLRKDTARQQAMLQLFDAEVEKFLANEKPKQGQTVRFAKWYRRPLTYMYPRRWDPRT